MRLQCVAVTELWSPSSITIGIESILNNGKFGAVAASVVRAEAGSQRGLQSPTVVRAAVAVAVFTLYHSLTHFYMTTLTLIWFGSPHWQKMRSSLVPLFSHC